MAKLPAECFSYYIGLGPSRSYQAVADHFGVSKRAVVDRAVRERWQQRVAEIERKAQSATDEKAAETLEAMNARHLKSLRLVQHKAISALASLAIESAMDAVRALAIALRDERVVRGQPSERTALAVEDIVKQEYQSWLTRGDEDEEDCESDVDNDPPSDAEPDAEAE